MSLLRTAKKKFLKMTGLRHVVDRLRARDPQRVFTQIYQEGAWRGKESVSGPGSDLEQTRVVIEALPQLLEELSIESMLDIPCGDWNWMRTLDLRGIRYIGGDIVPELVDEVRARHAGPGREFRHLDLIRDPLPEVDLVFCRDCLVHLSHADVRAALQNVVRSRSKYLLTTTFASRAENKDIPTGRWRPLNLERAPFGFPRPQRVINEGCSERNGALDDKALALWRVADLKRLLDDGQARAA